MKKSEEKWLQNKDFYPHAIWDAWYTHRWHMERIRGFVATFLRLSPQWWKVKKMKKHEEKWRKMKKMKKSEETWRKVETCDYTTKISEMPVTNTHTQMAHGWHMERDRGFVATFLHLSPQCWKSEDNEEKWRKWRKRKKSEEKWLQNKDFYRHAIWDAWYTHRWHMERNRGFVATFLHVSPQCWKVNKMKKSEENEEKGRK